MDCLLFSASLLTVVVVASIDGEKESRAGLRQVFHDDFTTLDHSQWRTEISASGFGDGEFQIYSPEARNCFVKDGVLYLKPTLTSDKFGEDFLHQGVLDIKKLYGNCTNSGNHGCYHDAQKNGIIPPTMSCKLMSNAAIRYGRVEVWAQMPEGDWIWPAIWLVPRKRAYGGWPRSGEIDIAELKGNLRNTGGTPRRVSSTVHFGRAWNHKHSASHDQHSGYPISVIQHDFYDGADGEDLFSSALWTEYMGRAIYLHSGMYSHGFHKYVMDWTASYIHIYVDDVKMLNVTTPAEGFFNHYFSGDNIYKAGEKNAPFDKEFYLILNVAVGGTKGWFYEGAKNSPYPKPWVNSEGQSTSMEKFWKDKEHWYPTWHGDTAAMKIRSVTMWTY